MSGVGVKGGSASRMRSAAKGEHRTGEHPAKRTLDAGETSHASGCWVGWMFLTRPAATRRVRGLGQSPMGARLEAEDLGSITVHIFKSLISLTHSINITVFTPYSVLGKVFNQWPTRLVK